MVKSEINGFNALCEPSITEARLHVQQRWLAKHVHQLKVNQLLERRHLPLKRILEWTRLQTSLMRCKDLRDLCYELDLWASLGTRKTWKNTAPWAPLEKYCGQAISQSMRVAFTMKGPKLSFTRCAASGHVSELI